MSISSASGLSEEQSQLIRSVVTDHNLSWSTQVESSRMTASKFKQILRTLKDAKDQCEAEEINLTSGNRTPIGWRSQSKTSRITASSFKRILRALKDANEFISANEINLTNSNITMEGT